MNLTLIASARPKPFADVFALLLAISLPWSTSATSICAALWLIASVPTYEWATLRRLILTPAGGLPLLFIAAGAAGMLWAQVIWSERFGGLSSFYKFLFIPILLHYFSRSGNARHVLIGFFLSCTTLLVLSWAIVAWAALVTSGATGIPVKDYISQGAMFTICMAVALRIACDTWRDKRRIWSVAFIMLGFLFMANIFYVATSRTSLIIVPALLIVLGYQQLGWKGIISAGIAFLLLAAAAWPSAGYLRQRVTTFVDEIHNYHPDGAPTPAGERLVFWTKSIGFIEAAPIFGHGTGSIKDQFRRSTIDRAGMAAEASANPHNQILAVGIQLGFAGIILLLAMWISHLRLFFASGTAGWFGLVVVIQNVIGSQFNSHLFDFTHGWLYVVGVGVAGGAVLRQSRQAKP